jgi:hypothetical protein
MRTRLLQHFRSQFVGYIALVIAIGGGTAYAANTIGSSDIIDESILSQDVKNGEIASADLKDSGVQGGDVRASTLNRSDVADESLTGHDIQDETIGGADVNESLLDPMTAAQIKDESLTGHDIQDNTIGGADVNESLLDPLTTDQIRDGSLTGHDIQDNTIGGLDVNESLLDGVAYSPAYTKHDPGDFDLPDDGSYAQVIYTGDGGQGNHGDPLVHVPVLGVVMANASLNVLQRHNSLSFVTCQLGLVEGGHQTFFGEPMIQIVDARTGRFTGYEAISLSGGTVATPGDYLVNVVCKSDDLAPGSDDRATFDGANLTAWAM